MLALSLFAIGFRYPRTIKISQSGCKGINDSVVSNVGKHVFYWDNNPVDGEVICPTLYFRRKPRDKETYFLFLCPLSGFCAPPPKVLPVSQTFLLKFLPVKLF